MTFEYILNVGRDAPLKLFSRSILPRSCCWVIRCSTSPSKKFNLGLSNYRSRFQSLPQSLDRVMAQVVEVVLDTAINHHPNGGDPSIFRPKAGSFRVYRVPITVQQKRRFHGLQPLRHPGQRPAYKAAVNSSVRHVPVKFARRPVTACKPFCPRLSSPSGEFSVLGAMVDDRTRRGLAEAESEEHCGRRARFCNKPKSVILLAPTPQNERPALELEIRPRTGTGRTGRAKHSKIRTDFGIVIRRCDPAGRAAIANTGVPHNVVTVLA